MHYFNFPIIPTFQEWKRRLRVLISLRSPVDLRPCEAEFKPLQLCLGPRLVLCPLQASCSPAKWLLERVLGTTGLGTVFYGFFCSVVLTS